MFISYNVFVYFGMKVLRSKKHRYSLGNSEYTYNGPITISDISNVADVHAGSLIASVHVITVSPLNENLAIVNYSITTHNDS